MSSRRPRVALVAASLDILGGQAVQADQVCRRIVAEGWEVSFVPINPQFPPGLEWLRGVPLARTMLNEALFVPSLSMLRRSDVVHVFCASYWSFLLAAAPALVVARALGKRVVLNYHSGEANDHLTRWGALVHPWLRLADEIVVPSEFLAAVFAQHGYAARVVHNVVDTSRFRYRDRVHPRPALLSNRNLESHYCVDNSLRAFSVLQRRRPDAEMTVAGDGGEAKRLRRLAETLCVEGVRFAGRVAPDLMPNLFDGADVFVNSSVIDNQPLSVLEAFAAGLPVVSTATGGIGALVRDGETGLLVAANDPAAMADAVESLLCRPQFTRRIALRARDELRLYSWESVRNGWHDVYRGNAA
jgi:glycosyltransferase involved in cell wall biosynthesis